jgi:hypothetical protein
VDSLYYSIDGAHLGLYGNPGNTISLKIAATGFENFSGGGKLETGREKGQTGERKEEVVKDEVIRGDETMGQRRDGQSNR